MDAVQEMCVELEKEVANLKDQLSQRDSKISQLEKVNTSTLHSPEYVSVSPLTLPHTPTEQQECHRVSD